MDRNETLIRARAIENTVFIAAADQVGNIFAGCSRIVDPMGVAVAAGGETEGLVFGDVDLGRIAAVREKLPLLRQRREEIYAQRGPAGHASRGPDERSDRETHARA